MPKTIEDYREGTHLRIIGELAASGISKPEAYASLRPRVLSQEIVFTRNTSAGRKPKPMDTQLVELKHAIGRIYKEMGKAAKSSFDSDEITSDDEDSSIVEIPEETEPEDDEPDEPEDEPEPVKPTAAGKNKLRNELEWYITEVERIMELCESRAATGARLDAIGMRPIEAGAKLIPAGIPAKALLHAMVMHWAPNIRREAGIEDFDFVKLSREIMSERGIVKIQRADGTMETPHKMFGYVLVLAENRQPIMLVGPAGTGKSYLMRQLADFLSANYGETPISGGATRGDLLGRLTANINKPFILSHFGQIYSGGGVFNFEELDAGDPRVLLVLNNALAGDKFFNSANGEDYDRSGDFIAGATANTWGTGATTEFTGRSKLDAATIDRWRMGRVWIDYDPAVAREILFKNA